MDIKISENLKKIREEHSLTQEALAESLGIPAIAVYMWEAGRLPLDKRALETIAAFFDVPVETLLEGVLDNNDKKSKKEKVSFKCKICGGDLVYDYNACTCKCANCGNKWAIAELYPQYSRILSTINKASQILNSKTGLSAADEVRLLFTQALNECNKLNDTISAELAKICNDGLAEADKFNAYCRGKYFYEKKSYKSALNELEKVSGYRDADDLITRCKRRS